MEFNKREKIIVITTSFLSNPLSQNVPKETLAIGLKVLLESQKMIIDLNEVNDIIDAVKTEQEQSIKAGFAYLHENKDRLQ